jgi:hypothetical protein
MFLNENKIIGLLCGRLGRYIVDDRGAYTMKRPDGSNVVLLENGSLQPVHPRKVHVEHLVNDGLLVQDGSKFHLKDGATEYVNADYSM